MKSDNTNFKPQRYNGWIRKIIIRCIDRISSQYNYAPKRGNLPDGGSLVIANHVSVDDQYLLTSYYNKDYLRFVAGEDVVRKPAMRWLLVELGTIIHMRGESELATTKRMIRYLKAGANVAIFPEGTSTFDGRTAHIDKTVAKIAKKSRCNLVMVRLEGMYLSKPRWRPTRCEGKVTLHEKVITPEQLALMSDEEMDMAVNEWLYTDAYKEFGKDSIKFIGKEPCKGLEACIYVCPGCGRISKLRTTANELYCECGYRTSMDEHGYLNDINGGKHIITELCDSQKAHLKELMSNSADAECLFEDDFDVNKVYQDGRREPCGTVHLEFWTDHTICECQTEAGTRCYNIKHTDIENVFIFKRNQWNCKIIDRDYRYELIGDFSANALKYRDAWDIVNNK